jgi:chemotaxis-related protein WspD
MSTIPLHVQGQARTAEEYAEAARRNLDRPVTPGYLREWAEHFRAPPEQDRQHDASGVVFRIGREWLCLPTAIFLEVAPLAQPHRLPHRTARGLRGVVNVSGKLYPCMGLAELFGIDEGEGVDSTSRHTFPRLLLVQWEGQGYALPVAELLGIVRYAAAEVKTPAATINKGLQRYLTGVLPHREVQVGCLDAALIGYQLARTLR